MSLNFKSLTVSAAMALGLATAAVAARLFTALPVIGPCGQPNYELKVEWANSVKALTNGRVEIEMLPVNSIVQHTETQDAVAAGIIDGHITDTSYFTGNDAAFGLIANPVGAWSSPYEMFAFLEYGGGNELMREILEPYGLHFSVPRHRA